MRAPITAWLVLSGCTGPAAEPAPDPLDQVWESALHAAARIQREVDCKDKVSGWLCYAGRLPGQAYPLPTGRRTFLGMTSLIRNSRAIPDGTNESLMTTEMTFDDGGVWLATVRPDSEEARGWYVPVASTVHKSLRGEAAEITITPALEAWFAEPLPGHYKIESDEHGYKFQGARPSRLVYIPAEGSQASVWALFELQAGGLFVSAFPDVPMVAR